MTGNRFLTWASVAGFGHGKEHSSAKSKVPQVNSQQIPMGAYQVS